ncbi:hypothetical protein RF11_09115 [Thelohanellus kitauei]|uniref:Tc1-like transposase DDE domain-containing protein n=1 Tax=Thelohanellus kitauei TaxID=669202 RepID=A0A0C2J6H0_THEKT|nr:hypothetical protein RF11_09115 [Thelohanellus kitauei]
MPKSKMVYLQQEISENIVTIVSQNNAVTFHGIKSTHVDRGVQNRFSTICRNLKSKNFTRKRIRRIPNERKSEDNLNALQIYWRFINDISGESLIFIDGTGINLLLNSHYEYALPINDRNIEFTYQSWLEYIMPRCHFDIWHI